MTLAGSTIDPGAGHVDTEMAGNEGPCPSIGPDDMEVENSPPLLSDLLPIEDVGDGADPNDLSNGSDESNDLVEQAALQWFTSVLQEAQGLTVQLESDMAHQKCKTPKMYQGNSRTMLYHCEMARKGLASQGFLDIRSFMALKEKEREEHEGSSDVPVIADQMTPGGPMINEEDEGDNDEIVILPGPVDYWASDENEGGNSGDTSNKDGGDFDLGIGGPQSALDAALDEIHSLNVWDDRESLWKACMPLLVMSKSTNFDALLRARLAGMLGVLNLYLDPALQYTWRRASEMWIIEFIHSGDIPQPQYSHSHQTVLDNEDVSHFIQLQIMAHTKGRYLTASDIVDVIAGHEVQEKFSQSGIIKPTISESMAR
ncbi:hypothetical protein H4582DRAFT_2071878 [Lactarius indigo]|nr:hypothetical protein H4582DRAFT_2071878 [Lactarius indigo]